MVFEGEALTYAELDARANRVAHVLRALGVGPDTLVGLYMPRSLELVVGALAIHKAGGAYVPLDPAYPADRIALYHRGQRRAGGPDPVRRRRRACRPHAAQVLDDRPRPADRGRAGDAGGERASARRTSPTSSTPRARPAGPRA